MSVHETSRIWRLDIPLSMKGPLLFMADCANPSTGAIFPNPRTTAAVTGCSVKTVRRAIAVAREKGWLTVLEHGGGKGNLTVYQFDHDALDRDAKIDPRNCVTPTQKTRPKVVTQTQLEEPNCVTQSPNCVPESPNCVTQSATPFTPLKEGTQINPKEPKGEGVLGEGFDLVTVEIVDDPPDGMPQSLDTQAFREVWAQWVKYRREIKHALKPTTVGLQFKQLAKYGPVVAAELLTEAMEKGWQGYVVPEKRHGARGGTTSVQQKLAALERHIGATH